MTLQIPKYFTRKDLNISGIYFLIKKKRVVYIGRTIDLMGRLLSHQVYSGDYDSIRIIPCDPADFSKYENRWITKFRPKYNRNGWKNLKSFSGKTYTGTFEIV